MKKHEATVCGLAILEEHPIVFKINTKIVKGSGCLNIIGKFGDKLVSSANSAFVHVLTYTDHYPLIDREFYKNKDVIVEINGIPKNGLSAGAAFATSFIMALSGKSKYNVCCTGRIELNGNILHVSNIEKKLSAAMKCDFDYIFIPYRNGIIRKDKRIVSVKNMDEISKLVFK